MSHWRRYPLYKPSVVEWLGDVPDEWKQSRLRFLCSITTGSKNTENSDPTGQYPFFVRADTVERLHTYSFDEEAILTAGDGVGVAKVFHYYKGKFDVHQRVYVLTKFKGILANFLFLYFKQNLADEVLKLSAKSTVDSLRLPMLQNFPVLIPSIPEQNAIAALLNCETTRIDALIQKKERQIELLQERCTALISHAVTKGLDPSVPIKDSGVEWLGTIPEGWNVTKFSRAAFYQEGPGLRYWQFSDSGIRVICVTNITDKGIDFSNYEKFISNDDYEENYQHFTVKKNDLLLSSSGNSWGKVARYLSDEKVILNTSTIRINELTPSKMILSFINLILQSKPCREQLGLMMTGSCQPNFGPSHLSQLIVPLPPIEDQIKIARHVDKLLQNDEIIISKIGKSVTILKEYRSALISAAVTGKIDLRHEVQA
jgi:type I restriction enzyme S subunit